MTDQNSGNNPSKAKLILGISALAVGLPALIFAFLGWSLTAQPLLADSRYVCVLGSLGAIILGSMLTNEGLSASKPLTITPKVQPVQNKDLDFLVMMEEEQEIAQGQSKE